MWTSSTGASFVWISPHLNAVESFLPIVIFFEIQCFYFIYNLKEDSAHWKDLLLSAALTSTVSNVTVPEKQL